MNTTGIQGNTYRPQETKATDAPKKTQANYGRTVGKPQLSETAAKYYEELKKKFSDMDFVLVSDDMKEQAEANAARFANPTKPVVLINESKIEEMATDENARAKYEGILSKAKTQLSGFAEQVAGTGAEVQGYGIKVDDNGNAKYFAVVKQSSDAQKARIAKRAEAKRAEHKAEEKKAAKKKEEERIRGEHVHGPKKQEDEEDSITFEADSPEELLAKLADYAFAKRADSVQTEAEMAVGQHIDFKG